MFLLRLKQCIYDIQISVDERECVSCVTVVHWNHISEDHFPHPEMEN
jgi:hypothetical protein